MNDLISRQAVLDGIFTLKNKHRYAGQTYSSWERGIMDAYSFVRSLPSVNTEKTGRWITEEVGEGHKVYCSECKESAVFEYARNGDIYYSYGHGVVKKTKYCPNCGAKMEESEE